MATFVIGDVHGCLETLQRLLETIDFSPESDRLWFVGDLVNGGPNSAGVLRFVRDLGNAATVVLGNHDFHLLTVNAGGRKLRKKDTFSDVLNAPDRTELLRWLRHRPLLHRSGKNLLVHAGLHPDWTVPLAEELARTLEDHLRQPGHDHFLNKVRGNNPRRWKKKLKGMKRLRVALNVFTRMRTLTPRRKLDFSFSGELADCPKKRTPWFRVANRNQQDHRIFFGHWSALGHRIFDEANVVALDSGCVWGRRMTAIRLEDADVTQVRSELA